MQEKLFVSMQCGIYVCNVVILAAVVLHKQQ